MNDIYTPELTRLLAARLDAGYIINTSQDRNQLDLNRISQVHRQAPWFFSLLAQELDAILARHSTAELLFVHGWNIGQPKCDVGIGAVEAGTTLTVVPGAHITVSEAYCREYLAALRACCSAVGISFSIGERYPAGHRNNLLQLVSVRGCEIEDPAAQRIAAWATAGRINAAQVELGIPLRWPGPWRDRFIQAFLNSRAPRDQHRADTVARGGAAPHSGPLRLGRPEAAAPPVAPSAARRGAALQFYDPRADVGVFAGSGRIGSHSTAGRLLLFLGGQRVALFTGEEAHRHATSVRPLEFTANAAGLRLRFAGPMLHLDDAAAYIDLEAALAASDIQENEVDLSFEVFHAGDAPFGAQFGAIHGHVRVGRQQHAIDARGFANAGGLRASTLQPQTMITAAFDSGGVLSRRAGDELTAWHFTAAAAAPLPSERLVVCCEDDADRVTAIELHTAAPPPLSAAPLSRMRILRGVGGSYLRVTFGIARFAWGQQAGYGLYEHARPVLTPA